MTDQIPDAVDEQERRLAQQFLVRSRRARLAAFEASDPAGRLAEMNREHRAVARRLAADYGFEDPAITVPRRRRRPDARDRVEPRRVYTRGGRPMRPLTHIRQTLDLIDLQQQAEMLGFPPGEFYALVDTTNKVSPTDIRLSVGRGIVQLLVWGCPPSEVTDIVLEVSSVGWSSGLVDMYCETQTHRWEFDRASREFVVALLGSPLVGWLGRLSRRQYVTLGVAIAAAIAVVIAMLEPHEVAAAMAFPEGYIPDTYTKRDRVKLAGNAVTAPVMTWIMQRVVDALRGQS